MSNLTPDRLTLYRTLLRMVREFRRYALLSAGITSLVSLPIIRFLLPHFVEGLNGAALSMLRGIQEGAGAVESTAATLQGPWEVVIVIVSALSLSFFLSTVFSFVGRHILLWGARKNEVITIGPCDKELSGVYYSSDNSAIWNEVMLEVIHDKRIFPIEGVISGRPVMVDGDRHIELLTLDARKYFTLVFWLTALVVLVSGVIGLI